MHRKYVISMVVISYVLLAGMLIGYTTWVDYKREANERKSDRQWCELVTFYDNYYQKNPPQSDLAKQQAILMHARRESLGCDNK